MSRPLFRAFHAAVQAIAATALWQQDELRVGLAISGGPGIHVHRQELPDLERFRSLMLDFRQFIANDDAANLNRTCNAVFANQEGDRSSSEDRAAVADARRRFHDALDQRADMYTHPEGAVPPTVRMLLEDWISGNWFHRDTERHERRKSYEFSADHDLSLVVIVPAVREAIRAAIEIDAILTNRLGDLA